MPMTRCVCLDVVFVCRDGVGCRVRDGVFVLVSPSCPFPLLFVRLSQVLPYVCSSVVVYTDSAAMPDVDRYVRRQVSLALQAVVASAPDSH